MTLIELAERLAKAETPPVLKFSVAAVAGRGGYEWASIATGSEATMRLICDMWNARKQIARALLTDGDSGEGRA